MKRAIVALVLLGYFQAALFYWRWGGIPSAFGGIACPLCPNIDGLGSNLDKFIRRTVGAGTLNAVALVVPFLIGYWIYRAIRGRLSRATHN